MPDPTEPGRPAPGGRTRSSAAQRAAAASRVLDGEASISEVATSLGVHPSTVRRWVREEGAARSRGAMTSSGSVSATRPPVSEDSEARALDSQPTPEATPPTPDGPLLSPEVPPPASDPVRPEPDLADRRPEHPLDQALGQPPDQPAGGEPIGAPDTHRGGAEADPDRVLPQVHRLRTRHRYLIVVAAWVAMLVLSAALPGPGALRGPLQLGHVLGLVAAVGAVAVIDWHGLLWMGRKRELHEAARIAAAVSPLIWAGLGLLGVTGILLKPNLGSALVWLKMVAVLLIAVNGVAASETRQVLRGVPAGMAFTDIPRPLATRLFASAILSQLAWLTAIIVGLSSQAARG